MTLRDVSGRLLVGAAFVASWNAVSYRGIQPVDLLLGGALVMSMFYLAGGKIPWIPAWAKWGSAAILIVLATHILFPANESYMSTRATYVPWFARVMGISLVENPAFRAAKWLIAMTVLPAVVADASTRNPRLVRQLGIACVLGAALSALVALTDLVGLTRINTYLIYIGAATARQAGLTSHPNHLGMSVGIVAPLAIGIATKSKWKGVPLVVLLLIGAIVSGSRAGQAGFVLAVTVTLAFSQRARRFAPILITVAGIVLASVVWVKPDLVETAATLFRFDTTDRYVAQSNEERAMLSDQAIKDFLERPLDGVGLEVLTQAHNIYLQIIAAGGVILSVGMFIYFAGLLRAGFAERKAADATGLYLLIGIIVWLAAATFGTQLTDRYLYFPVAGVAALQYQRILRARNIRRERTQALFGRQVSDREFPALSA